MGFAGRYLIVAVVAAVLVCCVRAGTEQDYWAMHDWVTANEVKMHRSLDFEHSDSKGWHLRATRGRIHAGQDILSVPVSATFSGSSFTEVVHTIGAMARQDDSAFDEYFRMIWKMPPVPEVIPTHIANKCLSRHFLKLYRSALSLFPKADQYAWEGVVVHTRGFNYLNTTFVVPVLDFANHATKNTAGAVAFQDGEEDENGDIAPSHVKLVAIRDIGRNEEVTISYGNIRSWVDTIDQYGFIDEHDITTVPAQMMFPESSSVYRVMNCTDDNPNLNFTVASGAPSDPLLICATLTVLGDDEKRAVFLAGKMPELMLLSLKIATFKQLHKFAAALSTEYDRPSQCDVSLLKEELPREALDLVAQGERVMQQMLRRVMTFCRFHAKRMARDYKAAAEKQGLASQKPTFHSFDDVMDWAEEEQKKQEL